MKNEYNKTYIDLLINKTTKITMDDSYNLEVQNFLNELYKEFNYIDESPYILLSYRYNKDKMLHPQYHLKCDFSDVQIEMDHNVSTDGIIIKS